jgi:hypothetical protein
LKEINNGESYKEFRLDPDTISNVLSEFPSVKDASKSLLLWYFCKKLFTNPDKNNEINDTEPSKIGHFHDTAAHIPIDIHKKYIVNSKGDLTGFLNLTIESAPTRPRERARLFDITEVTENVIIGSKRKDIE